MPGGAATAGWLEQPHPHGFLAGYKQGMPCSTALAVAVLQVACKALQLAPQGLGMWFIVPLITTVYLLLQPINRAAIYQVYTGHEIIDHRRAENWKRRKELFVKSPDLTHIWIFLIEVWYLVFAVRKQPYSLETLPTSHACHQKPFLCVAEVGCTKLQHTQPL